MTDQYAVMGHPVTHSKSPRIHAAFARQCRQDLVYTARDVLPGNFTAAVTDFFDSGGKGLNITVPYKQEAWALSATRSPEAAVAGAVNTLMLSANGGLYGHNTDGIGLVRDILRNHNGSLHDKHILILGAGGAARGILLPLLRERPVRIHIANRTASKAEALAGLFHDKGRVEASGFADLQGEAFDWVINASSASLQGELPPLPAGLLRPAAWCYDLMYATEPTVFCRWAQQQGVAHALDGLGMLVEQAAESFCLWRGVRPDTGPILAALRNP